MEGEVVMLWEAILLCGITAASTMGGQTVEVPLYTEYSEAAPEGNGFSLEQYDFGEIQDFIDEELDESGIDFETMVQQLLGGNIKETVSSITQMAWQLVMSEIETNKKAILQVILVAVVGAVFTNFSSVFQNSQISETGFFITYLLMIGLLAGSAAIGVSITTSVVEQLLEFMKAFIPSFFLSVAVVGGTTSSAAFYPLAFFLITVVEWALLYVGIPLIEVYIAILFVNYISGEDFLSKTAELIRTVVDWGLTTILGLVISVQVIQALIFPFVDAVKTNAIQKAVNAIPGIGDGVSAVSKMVLGSGILIKNGIGAAALVIIVVITVVPMLKLGIISLFYHAAAAIIQPMSDKRMSDSVSVAAQGSKLLLRVVFLAGLLFFITIAAVCSSTNISYM